MSEVSVASPSAVAIIETPCSFLAEARPNLPGALAHAGRIQLFGGHINDDENPHEAIRRELFEELDLRLQETPEPVWEGTVESQTKTGSPALRHVSLFLIHLAGSEKAQLKVPGKVVAISKDKESIDTYKDRLTPFAYEALCKAAAGEFAA